MKTKATKSGNPLGKLFSGPLSVEAEAEFKKLMIVEELLALMDEQGIKRSELAARMGVQPSRVTSMLTGASNFTIETLVRAGRAVNAELHQHFAPAEKQTRWQVYKESEVHGAFRARIRQAVRNPARFELPAQADEDEADAA